MSILVNVLIFEILVMWWALEKHKVPTKYITLIKDMYKDATMFVRTYDGNTTDFPIIMLRTCYAAGNRSTATM